MHTLLFLEPGHFHAALTLRTPNPRVSDEIVVYAPEGRELRDFLALVERFNGRSERPTRWRPTVIRGADSFSRLVDERRGDVVLLAGRNGGKAGTIRRLHDAGFHVLADKPWLVEPEDLEHVRASLAGGPLAIEIMTGRHALAAQLVKRLVDTAEVFGELGGAEPAIELGGVHHLEKLVDGAPLVRPWWFFDVRVQGSGAVDIPTHLVDQTQWLVDGRGGGAGEIPQLRSVRVWATRVPRETFRRITGEAGMPDALAAFVDGDALGYRCNTELTYRLAGVTARVSSRWELTEPAGGGDEHSGVIRGTRAEIRVEQGARTGYRRKIFVEPVEDPARLARALGDVVAGLQREWPGVGLTSGPSREHEVTIPVGLDAGHESHFPRVLEAFLSALDEHRRPVGLAERTLAKYTLLAEAAARATKETR